MASYSRNKTAAIIAVVATTVVLLMAVATALMATTNQNDPGNKSVGGKFDDVVTTSGTLVSKNDQSGSYVLECDGMRVFFECGQQKTSSWLSDNACIGDTITISHLYQELHDESHVIAIAYRVTIDARLKNEQ